MGLLQYTSKEMFSSTELVRRSKYIFDKLNSNEIEKAIVLRDGKPGVILLDFNYYEELINEYLSLKEKKQNEKTVIKPDLVSEKVLPNNNDVYKENNVEDVFEKKEDSEFSFDSDFTLDKNEPLKEFWD
ncbi:MAG: hypothetical protein PHG81_03365 [Aliarcobacter sp.]|nr:hypothetical protein [Aliarcobacter sp.]